MLSCHSKDRSPSPVSDLPPVNIVPQQNISITSTSSGGSSNGRGVIGVNTATGFPTTSHSSVNISDGSYPQQSPKVGLESEDEVFMYMVNHRSLPNNDNS
jgi:hypothetical protein